MSGILKRVALAEHKNGGGLGYIKFWDWSMVITSVGTAWEPSPVNQRFSNVMGATYEMEDQIAMINEIQFINIDAVRNLMGENVHGGLIYPRTGR